MEDDRKITPNAPSLTDAPSDKLPTWIPADAWDAYNEMRQLSRHPLTKRGQKLLVAQLTGFRGRGLDVAEALNQSTRAGWRGVFAPKPQGTSAIRSRADRFENRILSMGLSEGGNDQ